MTTLNCFSCLSRHKKVKVDAQTYHLLELSSLVDPKAPGLPGARHPRRIRTDEPGSSRKARRNARRAHSDGHYDLGADMYREPFITAVPSPYAPVDRELTNPLAPFPVARTSLPLASFRAAGSRPPRRFLSDLGSASAPAPARSGRRVRSEGDAARAENDEDFQRVLMGHMQFAGEYETPTVPFSTPAADPKSKLKPPKDTEMYFSGRHPLYPIVRNPDERQVSLVADRRNRKKGDKGSK
jgi:hypothetical protein